MSYSCIVASAMHHPPNIKFDYQPVVCLMCTLSLVVRPIVELPLFPYLSNTI